MPINVFQRQAMNDSVNQGLGFNLQNMIAQGGRQVMADVNERRQMGRRKFGQDMLSQQLEQAGMDLENQRASLANQEGRFRFGQEQEYYGGLHTPAGQAALKAYSERLGIPHVGNITTPQGLQVHQQFGDDINAEESNNKQIAAEILRSYVPQIDPNTRQMMPDPPEIAWARSAIGIPTPGTAQPAPPVEESEVAAPTAPRGALGVFLNQALPPLVGGGSAVAAASKTPGPWPVKLGAAGLAYGLGDRLARFTAGGITPEEAEAHPTAATAGQAAGVVGSIGSGVLKSIPGAGVGNQAGSSLLSGIGSRLKNMMGGAQPPSAVTGSGAAGTVAKAASKAKAPPKGMAGVTPPGRRGRGVPQAAPTPPLAKPVGQRGRQMPIGRPTSPSSFPSGTPSPGSRGRGVPQSAPSSLAWPVSARGRQMPGGGGGNAAASAAIQKFFALNGRLPTPAEMAALIP